MAPNSVQSGVFDYSGRKDEGYSGQVYLLNSNVGYQAGKLGNATNFSGGKFDGTSMTVSGLALYSQPFTVAFWYNHNCTDSSLRYIFGSAHSLWEPFKWYIVSKSVDLTNCSLYPDNETCTNAGCIPNWGEGEYYGCYGAGTNGSLVMSSENPTLAFQPINGSLVSDGNWHRIVYVREGNGDNQSFVYVDNTKIITQKMYNPSYFLGGGGMRVGNDRWDQYSAFDGLLDDLQVYGPYSEFVTDGYYWDYMDVQEDWNNGLGKEASALVYLSGINWLTLGKAALVNLTYGQTLDWIAVTAENATTIQNITLNLTSPDGVVTSILMTNDRINNWNYTTNTFLNQIGEWNISIVANVINDSDTLYSSFNVSTNQISIIEGWYGYTLDKILSLSEQTDAIEYNYDLVEMRINSTMLDNNWTSLLAAINISNALNVRVGINVYIDLNLTDVNGISSNITAYFSNLLSDPYYGTVVYISFELSDLTSYTGAEKYGALNNLSDVAVIAINNKFPVYSKNYDNESLDPSFITYTPLVYIQLGAASSEADWINHEAHTIKTNSSLNRVYVKPTVTQQPLIKLYQTNILNRLRDTIETTNEVTDTVVGELTNGDIVVFNNGAADAMITVNVSNMSTNSGKDFWDTTHKLMIDRDSIIREMDVNVSAYSATYVFAGP